MRPKPKQTIGFRLDDRHLKQLERGASDYGVSIHEFARGLLIERLEDADRARLFEDVTELRDELTRHRDEFAAAVLAVLLAARAPQATTADETQQWTEEAHQWVEANLRG